MQFEDIKGLGTKRIQKLKEAGFNSPVDLLTIFPSKYVSSNSKLGDFSEGDEAALIVQCVSLSVCRFVRKNLSFVRATFSDGQNSFDCVWFNQPFVKRQIVVNKKYAIVGRVKKIGKKTEIYVSVSSALDSEQGIVTIYRSYNGIPAKIIKDAIYQILDKVTIQGQISDEICEKNGLLPLNYCIKTIHRPQNEEDLRQSKISAAIQILAYNIFVFLAIKGQNSQNKGKNYKDNRAILQNVINSLPFRLTHDQFETIENIETDLHSAKRMNRLIEGDVGCGKTIVAFLAMYYVALSGYQAALMAPTEILARQHFSKALDFFGKLGIKCELICGSQSRDRRMEALFNIETGNAQIVIGTHALFQSSVVFKNLALTVADEQQRFGVEQRGSLENKGESVDSLVMSATPIPRTLALTLYGDLDISIIKTMPLHKASIATKFVPKCKGQDMLDYVYRKSLDGEKTYIVCPRVDDSESISVTDVYKRLKSKYGDTVGMVHGQMSDENKNSIMSSFASGEIKILVCTTVIEVGIDVPDAVNIIIYDAESYGLSQLHQLRGRVGRGNKDSYCFVISKFDKPDDRLNYFMKTDNGFELAEYDFKVRGAGDFLGTRQHGTDNIFWDIGISEDILSRAKSLADKLTSSNIDLENKTFDYIKGLTLN